MSLFIYNYFVIGNHFRVLFAILTNINITGTSTSTPTTVANAAPDCKPNRETILNNPLHIVLIAVPLVLQTVLIFFVAYGWAKWWKLPHDILRLPE